MRDSVSGPRTSLALSLGAVIDNVGYLVLPEKDFYFGKLDAPLEECFSQSKYLATYLNSVSADRGFPNYDFEPLAVEHIFVDCYAHTIVQGVIPKGPAVFMDPWWGTDLTVGHY